MPRVYVERVPTLDGRVEERVVRVGDGAILKLFTSTRPPRKDTDIVCPHFMELKWANGCPYSCAWCYLQGTFRLLERGKRPYIKDWRKITSHLRAFFGVQTRPELVNAGELCDSLIGEHLTPPASWRLIELFSEQKRHRLLLVTKSDRVENLLKVEPAGTVVSFSVNAYPVAERWEKGAPPPLNRIRAGKALSEHGYEVRVRLDPIVPVEGWEKHYAAVIDDLFRSFEPERITLGTLRGLWTTIRNCRDRSWVEYVKEKTNWGLKPPFDVRLNVYRKVLDMLEDYGYGQRTALCKETAGMWEALGMDYRKIRCNCTL